MSDITINGNSLVERDTKAFYGKDRYNVADLIAHAARKSGRGAFAIGREMLKHAHGPAKLKFNEYVQYGLYDPERHSEPERRAFISGYMHGKIVGDCINRDWHEVTNDKWINSVYVQSDGIAVPEILAVIDSSPRAYQNVEKLSGADALRGFLTQYREFPLFCKFNAGCWSVGASIITDADDTHIHLRGKAPMRYADFLGEIVGDDVFLIQKFVQNHAFLLDYTPTTATVRTINMWTDDGLWTPHALLKLPSGRNEADNFWRSGNLVCALDAETGEILSVVGKDGPDLKNHDQHPETGRDILGKRLPHWQAVCEMNARAAALHSPVRYSSTDIAITDAGPVLIEFNWGAAFELPQIATGKGFMTEPVRAFFRSCGSKRV